MVSEVSYADIAELSAMQCGGLRSARSGHRFERPALEKRTFRVPYRSDCFSNKAALACQAIWHTIVRRVSGQVTVIH